MTTTRAGSVKTRIVWSTAAVTVVAMALMVLVVLVIVTRLNTDRIDAALKDRLAATTAAMTREPGGGLVIADAGTDEVMDTVWVFDADGSQVAGPDAGSRVRTTVDSLSRSRRTTRIERHDRVYIAVPIKLAGERHASGVAVATENLEAYESSRDLLVAGLVVLGVLVTTVAAAITSWTVSRTLRPVQRMTELAGQWSDQDLQTRFDLGEQRTDELTRLGNTLDALLDRVADAIRNEQQLTAELAHELRTPLTSIRGEAELGLLTATDAAMHERLERIVTEVERLTATIATLLALARHQHGPPHRADIDAVIASLAASRNGPGNGPGNGTGNGTGHARIRVEARTGADRLQVAADPALIERVIGPVVDNALRYAASSVLISTDRAGHDARIQVTDDGPGVAADLVDDIFVAGVRDPAGDGAGLGLPLARRVATGIRGSVTLVSRGAPTVVEIRFPLR